MHNGREYSSVVACRVFRLISDHTDRAMSVFKNTPVSRLSQRVTSDWDDRTTQQKRRLRMLTLMAYGRRDKLVPVTGENSNGSSLALGSQDLKKRGLRGVSSGSPPATSGFAIKLMMKALTSKRKLTMYV